jgi:hypothetical protein
VQQPAGVDEMITAYPANSIGPASCGKNNLFRHSILLPKIKNSPINQSRIGQWITFPLSITKMFYLKTNINGFVSPFINDKKQKRRN